MKKWAAALVPALLLLGVGAPVVHAHARLVSAQPAQDATIKASPAALVVEFSEALEPAFSTLAITAPADAAGKLGPATPAESDGSALTAPVAEPLAPGRYTVVWNILSKDGHKMKGSYQFTIAP